MFYPGAEIDGVELDPAVTAVGRNSWFGLGRQPAASPCARRTRARSSLATEVRYDLILIDAYRQPYVPFYLATARVLPALPGSGYAPGGVVALNVSTVPGDDRLAEAVAGTLRAEFPQVVTWQALTFNQFVVGLTRPLPRAVMTARLNAAPRDLLPLTRLFARDLRQAAPAERSLDGRPCSGGVDHRPDDRLLRPARRRDTGATAPHRAGLSAGLRRRIAPAPRHGPPGRSSLPPAPASPPVFTRV